MTEVHHWRKSFNPHYLGSWDFLPHEEKFVTIRDTVEETVTGPDGKQDECLVARFTQEGLKPFILNSTNCRTITKIAGTPYREEWAGVNLVLTVRRVQAFGEQVDAVRVKLEKVKNICSHCGRRVEATEKMGAEELATWTREKLGAVMCAKCARNAREG